MSDPRPGARPSPGPPRGVVFDLDGVIADTERLWTESWIACTRRHGADWTEADSTEVMGMSGPEWSRHVSEHIRHRAGAGPGPQEVYAECVRFVVEAVDEGRGPLLAGAGELVRDVAARVPVALASSAAREVIDTVLRRAGMTDVFAATVSSEEVDRGKPAPDVYAEALRRLGPEAADHGLAVEDSTNGIRSASAAGLAVVAIPNPHFPPRADALALADLVAHDHHEARDYVLSLLAERATP